MTKTLKTHASLLGVNVVNDEARLSRLAMTQSVGFTMAEILLSLTIIGVVAAITLPSLMANINERTWNTQRKALYARLSQAIAMMPQLNGYGEYEGTNTDGSVTVTKDTAAEAFLTEGLSKVFKISNICDSEHLTDCGIADSYINPLGVAKVWPKKMSEIQPLFTASYVAANSLVYQNPQKDIDTKAAAFETQNGESIALYYNPFCFDMGVGYYSQMAMCANFIYDLNGLKGPNTVGKDIGFMTAIYPINSVVVAPFMATKTSTDAYEQRMAGSYCATLGEEYRLPNIEEIKSIFYNQELTSMAGNRNKFWSSTIHSSEFAEYFSFQIGDTQKYARSNMLYVLCVQR